MIKEKEKEPKVYLEHSARPGTRSDFYRPMILELFAKGQGKEVLELLHSVNLEVKEVASKPGFRIIQKGK